MALAAYETSPLPPGSRPAPGHGPPSSQELLTAMHRKCSPHTVTEPPCYRDGKSTASHLLLIAKAGVLGSSGTARPCSPSWVLLLPPQVPSWLGTEGSVNSWDRQNDDKVHIPCTVTGPEREKAAEDKLETQRVSGPCLSCSGFTGCHWHYISSLCTDMLLWNQYMPLPLGL